MYRILEDQVVELEQMLEQSNADKQQWKQMAHTLADALEHLKDKAKIAGGNVTFSIEDEKVNNALEQFKNMKG